MAHTAPRKTIQLGDLGSRFKPERDREHQYLRELFIDILSRLGTPIVEGVVKTTDATQTTLVKIDIEDDTVHLLEARVTARRTGGSSGSSGDGAAYIFRAAYNNIGGVGTTIIGSIDSTFTAENQSGWNATFDIDGDDVRVRVTGAANNNVTWHGEIRILEI